MSDNGWEQIGDMARGVGKTHQMIQAAKALGGTLIVGDEAEARRIEKEHGIKAVGWQRNLRGFRGPFLVDPRAVSNYAAQMQSENAALKERVRELDEAERHALGQVLTKLELAESVIELKEKLATAREALEFYAHVVGYEPMVTLGGYRSPGILKDGGGKARQALKDIDCSLSGAVQNKVNSEGGGE